MSSLTRTTTLAASVLAAVRGKKNGNRLEDERPEETDAVEEEDQTDPEAEGDDTEPDAETEETDPDAEDDATDPEASAEDEADPKKAAASARRAEQGRIKSILTHPMADANPALAAELAFGTKAYSSKVAGVLMTSAAAGGRSRLGDRMQGRSPKLGYSAPVTPKTERQSVLASAAATIQAIHGRKSRKGA
ncbi:hypothetical protein [Rhizobium sp. Root483D2]|uniref:hypothetical protein n=1 Tax=Rhizobium sp. Root483D2 TaxID=1736545 RepID=UPI000713B4C2|nr:hypothetical protein [Rhizobium sp. Root483D2]KQY20781.1 hypothetical protein ASD32_05035 [Rhizobium sp. Root483D2]